MGLFIVGQVGGFNIVSYFVFFICVYNLIWNEWFCDENFQDFVVVDCDDGFDVLGDYVLFCCGK